MARQILVVDDEEATRSSVSKLLTENNLRCVTAENGAAALAKAKEEHFDLAVVDLKLPDIDGLELVSQLKKIRPQARYLLLTGHGSIETSLSASHKDVCDYIVKPIPLKDLLERIQQCLG